MSWRQQATEKLVEYLRFTMRGAFMVNGIVLALASIYLVAKFVWFAIRWIDRVAFFKPW